MGKGEGGTPPQTQKMVLASIREEETKSAPVENEVTHLRIFYLIPLCFVVFLYINHKTSKIFA